ncbi:CrcB family protein [Halorussus sp. MSC15.2]|uniref:fluoride efflux transporter FluC n=1 Tax=Halorussus sp. MSC15.2 TaxID=2283638 RepID=UPI0013D6A740|nr:CrcB family protein [Halorussus sp. MSC15.2]NEU57961.1 CrcB family protein [Halorussus sp. MSC15.2]
MSETDAGSASESETASRTADANPANDDSTAESAETEHVGTEDVEAEQSGTPVHVPALKRLQPLVLVAVGGFAGAVLRHAVAAALPSGFPWGTLAVNVTGSFALGVLLSESPLAGRISSETRLVLATGFLSSFTTYSTFALQTTTLSPSWAVVNVGANYALGFAAVVSGRAAVGEVTG